MTGGDGSNLLEILAKASQLDDDDVKLIPYTIVSIRPLHERAVDGGSGEEVVAERMTTDAFLSLVIGKYLQSDDGHKLDEQDRQYLRVHYEVVHRWPREPLRFREQRLDVMRDMSAKMPHPDGGSRA